jgi:hypothetical protein
VSIERIGALLWPVVAEEARDSDLERIGGVGRIALEEPLRRVIGVGLGQRAGLVGDLAPAWQIKRNLDEGQVCYANLLINSAYGAMEFG